MYQRRDKKYKMKLDYQNIYKLYKEDDDVQIHKYFILKS